MSLVSIIVPVYNSALYLSECIDSLINQSHTNIEIILINDGSTDNSENICLRYVDKDKRIKYHKQINSGVSKARNNAIKLTKGEYLLFVDSDDIINNQLIEKTLSFLLMYNSDTVIFKYKKFQYTIAENIFSEKIEIYTTQQALEEFFKGYYYRGICWNKLYKTSLLKDIYFPENKKYGEDSLFTYFHLLKCNTVLFIHSELYYYRDTPNSAMNQPFDDKRLQILDTYITIYKSISTLFPKLIPLFIKAFTDRYFDLILEAKKNNNYNNKYFSFYTKKIKLKHVLIGNITIKQKTILLKDLVSKENR